MNKVLLLGRVTECHPVEKTANGLLFVNLDIETVDNYIINGTKQSKSVSHVVTFWGNSSELATAARVGDMVMIEASHKTAKYTGKDGVIRSSSTLSGSKISIITNNREESGQTQQEIPF